MPTSEPSPTIRLSAEERREAVLTAATRAFARGGLHGTSTDAVAREAGVSQPYVVRLFGTKLALFLEVFERAGRAVDAVFAAVLAEGFDPGRDEDWERLGAAYFELVRDRDLLLVMMHGFTAGDDEPVGAVGRDCMARINATLRSAGASPEQARDFVAQGMLLNVMIAIRAPEHRGDALSPLTECAFGDALAGLAPPAPPASPASPASR